MTGAVAAVYEEVSDASTVIAVESTSTGVPPRTRATCTVTAPDEETVVTASTAGAEADGAQGVPVDDCAVRSEDRHGCV